MYDVVIVGAGPAGLSAALLLGRCRRRTLLCDAGRPRNRASQALHGFLTRDGVSPLELRRIGREQLGSYATVSYRDAEIVDARALEGRFEVEFATGERAEGRMLLLATGVRDELPPVPGIEAFYGRSVFHCPYCDGWEMRDRALAAHGRGASGLALELKQWSDDVVLCTDGPAEHSTSTEERLQRAGIPVIRDRIVGVRGMDGELEEIVFEGGRRLHRHAIFFRTAQRQASDLAEKLGCRFTKQGSVDTGKYEITHVPGLYVAGDASRNVQLAIIAASEGAQAAFAINMALMKADLP